MVNRPIRLVRLFTGNGNGVNLRLLALLAPSQRWLKAFASSAAVATTSLRVSDRDWPIECYNKALRLTVRMRGSLGARQPLGTSVPLCSDVPAT